MTIRLDAGKREGHGKPSKRPKVLITGGRAPVALEMARMLAEAGCEVHAAESLRFHLCRVSKAVTSSTHVPSPAWDTEGFLSGLERIVRREGIDWIVPTCEEIFYVSSGLERLERLCRVFAAPLGQLRRLHSKWLFIRRAEELGFAVPATRLLASPAEWSDTMARTIPEWADGVVLKPEFSRSGTKVRIIRQETGGRGVYGSVGQSANLIDRRKSPVPEGSGYPWVAQQYIRGQGLCTYSIVHDGKLAAHAAYAVTYSVRGGACFYFEPLNDPRLKEWVRTFARHERFTGQLAFDFIESADGVLYPIECNPRATSGIHLFGPEDRLADALFDPDSLGDTIVEPQPTTRKMLAVPMLALGWKNGGPGRSLLIWLRKLASARDVVYRRDDPRPFREQLLLLNELRRIARARGQTMMEASTCDIEWNGGLL
ncbi:hypothetical protein FE783_05045 [Paenibacillus mesophilus]|uniref:hypothetical protein n=1 Tax=Paenibacillus mesophilus TaxID=2582849 RepID=UPI00110D9AF9|nr:hypothetical protein [Paenibacillus mesophilus]TMV52309.1 hypothetical protein FE783_05045 [Paenibacillus mesophilus]